MSFIDYRMLEIGNAARKFSENLTEEEEKRFSGGRASPYTSWVAERDQ